MSPRMSWGMLLNLRPFISRFACFLICTDFSLQYKIHSCYKLFFPSLFFFFFEREDSRSCNLARPVRPPSCSSKIFCFLDCRRPVTTRAPPARVKISPPPRRYFAPRCKGPWRWRFGPSMPVSVLLVDGPWAGLFSRRKGLLFTWQAATTSAH